MHTFSLPQELIDAVIAELHANQAALRACTLVCHSWSVPAQRSLFSTILLAPSLFGMSSSPGTSLIARLHALAARSPHLLQYVKVLEFDPTCDAVQYLFSGSKVLQELRLVNFLGDMSKTEDVMRSMLSLPSITRLTIKEGPLYPAQVVPLLLHCPHLRSLTLSRVMVGSPLDLVTVDDRKLPLDSLSVNRLMPEILADLAERSVDLTRLRSFSAQFYPYFYDQRRIERSVPIVQDVLRSIEGTLEHLSLDFSLDEPLSKLISFSRLRSLDIHLPTPKLKSEASYAASESTLLWLIASLKSFEGVSLEHVNLQRLPTTETCSRLTRRIDEYLCALVNLRKVSIGFFEPKGKATSSNLGQEYFPLLAERGILQQFSKAPSLVERAAMSD